MLRMKASAVMRKVSDPGLLLPARREDVALEADVVGLGRGEGGEVVGAEQGGCAGVEGVAVQRWGHQRARPCSNGLGALRVRTR